MNAYSMREAMTRAISFLVLYPQSRVFVFVRPSNSNIAWDMVCTALPFPNRMFEHMQVTRRMVLVDSTMPNPDDWSLRLNEEGIYSGDNSQAMIRGVYGDDILWVFDHRMIESIRVAKHCCVSPNNQIITFDTYHDAKPDTEAAATVAAKEAD